MARTNLAIRPSVKVNATNWFGASGWARIAAGVHASLPRTTAFAGTTVPCDVQADRGAVTPGKWYVYSISVRFVGASTVTTNIDWYTGASSYIETTDGNIYNQAGGTTRRLVSGVGQAPATAATIRPNIVGFDAEAQLTALLIEEYDSEAEATAALAAHETAAHYFDGDGDGVGNTGAPWAWTGTDGQSTSTSTADITPSASVPFAAMSITGAGIRESFGSAAVNFGPMSITTGLIATAIYDDRRGRVRVNATGLPETVIRAVVSSRPLGKSRWTEVRGGRIAVEDEAFVRPVDHYEYPGGGVAMQYRIVALSSAENQPDAVVQTKIIQATEIGDDVWLKFIAAPYLNRKVHLHSWSEVTRESKNATYQVRGRVGPVAVTDVHDARAFTIQIITATIADRDALDNALSLGAPIYLQTPTSIPCPTIYAVIGSYGWRSLNETSTRSLFTIPLTEVSAPPPSIVGVGLTWSIVTDSYGDWAEVGDTFASWLELMS
jgi:hypothetical protein